MAISKKTCLITGCSAGGVGAALAEIFRDHDYHVFATARTTSKISSSLQNAPNVTVLALDVTSAESIAATLNLVQTQTTKLDVLINNAGLGLRMPGLDTSLEEAKNLFDANFFAAFAMMQAFAPLLIEARGCLVNNSSITGALPFPFTSALPAGRKRWEM
ncbi:hypothetical protein NQ176_g10702 [Zarea fungicola]|uniref:Uncharacterized protein n=1 Tax=Zarea fungicola TaxID=93591 RepID=A0ACC1MF03_9HYPO|nr:hypothetical protein NQ176_g10702 [Lecanicillium fungicola]